MNCEPAFAASSNCFGLRIVPAPTIASGTSAASTADAFQRIVGAQRDLDHPQTARRQGARQRHGIFDAVDLQHRNDRLAVEKGEEFFRLAGHSAAPRDCNFNRFNRRRMASPCDALHGLLDALVRCRVKPS